MVVILKTFLFLVIMWYNLIKLWNFYEKVYFRINNK